MSPVDANSHVCCTAILVFSLRQPTIELFSDVHHAHVAVRHAPKVQLRTHPNTSLGSQPSAVGFCQALIESAHLSTSGHGKPAYERSVLLYITALVRSLLALKWVTHI